MIKEWSAQEIKILRDNYVNSTKEDLLKMLPNRTWISIRAYATKHLGLSRVKSDMLRKKWTSDEEDKIYAMISEYNVSQMADFFNVSYNKMEDKIHKMGLRKKEASGELWTSDEEEILIEHYCSAPKDFILELIPNRSWLAITQHGNKELNIKREASDDIYLEYKFFDTWTERSAYILGFIMADGYLQLKEKKGYRDILQIGISVKDIDIIYKIAAALKFRGIISYYRHQHIDRKSVTEVSIRCTNKYLIRKAIEKGIPAKDKSNTATFPDNIPDDLVKHFIRGLIDGDGWVSYCIKSRGSKEYPSARIGLCGTYDIVSKTKDLLPIDCSDIPVTQNTNTNYRWNIEGKRAFEIMKWLYEGAEIFLDRKYDQYCQAKQKYAPSSE